MASWAKIKNASNKKSGSNQKGKSSQDEKNLHHQIIWEKQVKFELWQHLKLHNLRYFYSDVKQVNLPLSNLV